MSGGNRRVRRALFGGGHAGAAGKATGRQMTGNIAVQFGGRVIGIAVALVTVPIMARTLGPDGLGVFTATLAYVGIFGAFTQLGLTAAAVQRMAAEPEREAEWLRALVRLRLLLSLVMTALCVVFIPVVLSAEDDARTVAAIFSLTILLGAAGSMMSVFQTRLRAAVPQALAVTQGLVWLLTVIVLGLIESGTVGFAVGYTAVAIALAAMQVLATRQLAGISSSIGPTPWRALARLALPLGVAGIMIFIYYRVDAVLLLELSGPDEAGIYGAAYRFLDSLLFLPAVVMATFYPVLSAVFERDTSRGRLLVQRCAEGMWVITLPCFIVTLALSDQIVSLLFGAEFARSAEVLPILMAALVSIGFGSLAGLLAPILGLQWRLALFATIGALANVALNVLLIPRYGAVGSASATLVTEALTMTLMFATALAALRMRLALQRFVGAAVAAAGMWLVLVAVRPLGLLPALIAGSLVYAALLLILRVVRVHELRALRDGSPESAGSGADLART